MHLISSQGEINEVSVAKQHNDEAALIAELVGKPALHYWNDGATDDHGD